MAKPLRLPLLMLAVVACLLVCVDLMDQWLPPPAPPRLSWSGARPLAVLLGRYSVSATAVVEVHGQWYLTGVDVTLSNAQVLVDGVPVTDARVAAEQTAGALRGLLSGEGVYGAEVDSLLERAVASPGTRVSLTFADRRWNDALMTSRAGVLAVLWVALGLAVVWAGLRGLARLGERRAEKMERCRRCGYSMSGLKDGAPCPECAMPAVRSSDPYVERLKKKQWRKEEHGGG